ncbi:MAG: hypothetical protein A3A97_04820 [Candidatus Terrybacteria bacterium RIFCSPLOWO2_01_FULL_40_23]|uniref:Uncharacterized protein n=1 Tax=Candidatus Terrybacteria bacterium RIFCSPLOWO2_01_FULL_40_23 TaxID=1802366 RepID=A0A1G2PV58_9BACT|nr:MAG: hypothetical protein UT82_C0014G0051 [Parcubacteria group bacterium GW2011_GWB1_40_14]OHA52200.1 MAG: hypothetical protein A3A97_04820 [Candidatus Terrybacteria bacterium RIFCSPLOWO2_01_FULL_40_23]
MDNNPQKTNFTQEFVEPETKPYKHKIGTDIASSLSGFIFGFVAGSIAIGLIWWAYAVSRVQTP